MFFFLLSVDFQLDFFFSFFFFWYGFYSPFKNISLILSWSFIKLGENQRTRGKSTWPSVSRTWLSYMWPEWGSNYSIEKPKIKSQLSYPLGYRGLQFITKTRLYDFNPLKPHFYIVKLGFTGVYIIFLILLKYIDCGYLLELPRRGGSNEYPQSMFWSEIWRNIEIFYLKIYLFWL